MPRRRLVHITAILHCTRARLLEAVHMGAQSPTMRQAVEGVLTGFAQGARSPMEGLGVFKSCREAVMGQPPIGLSFRRVSADAGGDAVSCGAGSREE